MSDTPAPDTRSRDGSAADRKLPIPNSIAYGLGGGAAAGTLDWLILGCLNGGHWHYVNPDKALVYMWAGALVPVVHIILRIGGNYLAKLEKASEQ